MPSCRGGCWRLRSHMAQKKAQTTQGEATGMRSRARCVGDTRPEEWHATLCARQMKKGKKPAPFLRRGPVFGFLPLRSPVVLKREFSSKLHTLQPYLPYMVNGGAYIRQPASARSRARDKYRTKHVTCIRRHVPFDLCMPPRASAQCAQRARISGSTVLRLERCIMDSGCLSTCERRARVCRRWK